MKQVIVCVQEGVEYTLTSRGHTMQLIKTTDGWNMFTQNASTRAYRGLGYSFYVTLEEVERKYKSWRGISALVNSVRTVPSPTHHGRIVH